MQLKHLWICTEYDSDRMQCVIPLQFYVHFEMSSLPMFRKHLNTRCIYDELL